jgi:hypothetical protein
MTGGWVLSAEVTRTVSSNEFTLFLRGVMVQHHEVVESYEELAYLLPRQMINQLTSPTDPSISGQGNNYTSLSLSCCDDTMTLTHKDHKHSALPSWGGHKASQSKLLIDFRREYFLARESSEDEEGSQAESNSLLVSCLGGSLNSLLECLN